MIQALGAVLVLMGAIMFHIAAADLPHHSVQDIWTDFRNILSGTNA